MKYYRILSWLWIGYMVAGVAALMIAFMTDHSEFGYGIVVGTAVYSWVHHKSDELLKRMREDNR